MFFNSIFLILKKLTILQYFLYLLLVIIIHYIDLPLLGSYPLRVFSKNFKSVVLMALNYNPPQKFIDMTLDSSEYYFFEKNNTTELVYFTKIIFLAPTHYWSLVLLTCIYQTLRIWWINFIFWFYSISLPFFFLGIFLFIDYLDGYFD